MQGLLGSRRVPSTLWLERFGFVSPVLAATRPFLALSQRAYVESILGRLQRKLRNEAIPPEGETTIKTTTDEDDFVKSHICYLRALLEVYQDLADASRCDYHPSADYGVSKNGDRKGSANRALLVPASYFNDESRYEVVHANVTRNIEGIISRKGSKCYKLKIPWNWTPAVDQLLKQKGWLKLRAALWTILIARIVCYEVKIFSYHCSFRVEEIEPRLINAGVYDGRFTLVMKLGNGEAVKKLLKEALAKHDEEWMIKRLEKMLGLKECEWEEKLGVKLIVEGTIAEHVPVFFGTEAYRGVFTRTQPIVQREFSKAKNWVYIKGDLRRLADAMCGVIPPEEVHNLNFYRNKE